MKELALRNGSAVTKNEILQIREKHAELLRISNSILPIAIEIGEWFLGCRNRVKKGQWMNWLDSNFPDITIRTIENYVLLARHRKFLEAKFSIRNAISNFEAVPRPKETTPGVLEIRLDRDALRAPGISEALRAIRETNRVMRNPRVGKIIEVDSVAEKKATRGNAERAINWPTPVERVQELEPVQPRTEPIETQSEDPKRVLDRMVKSYLYHQTLADETLVEIRDYIRLAAMKDKTIRYCVDIAAEDAPKLKAKLLAVLLASPS